MLPLLLRRSVCAKAIGALLLAGAISARPLAAQGAGGHGTENQAIAQYYYAYTWGNVFHWHDCNLGPTEPCGPGPQSDVNAMTAATADGSYGLGSTHVSATGPLPNGNSGDAHANSYWWDTFTVTSATLPVGTLVPIDLTLHFNASLGNPLQDAGIGTVSFAQAHFWYGGFSAGIGPNPRIGYQGTPGQSLDAMLHYVLWQQVGETFKLGGNTEIMNNWCPQCGPTSVDLQTQFWVDIGDGTIPGEYADVALVTESGTNYASTVAPEPSTFVLTLLPIVAVVGASRRRRRR